MCRPLYEEKERVKDTCKKVNVSECQVLYMRVSEPIARKTRRAIMLRLVIEKKVRRNMHVLTVRQADWQTFIVEHIFIATSFPLNQQR